MKKQAKVSDWLVICAIPDLFDSSVNKPAPSLRYYAVVSFVKLPMTMLGRPVWS